MPAFEEKTRDTHAFSRRVGDLPVQKEGEEYDYRGLLHRDGTVFSAVELKELKAADVSVAGGMGGRGGQEGWWGG